MRAAPPFDDWPPLRCTACATEAPLETPAYRCPGCGAPWTWDLPTPAFPLAEIAARPPTLWRYAEALPRFARPVSLGEPITPLVELDPPRRARGVRLLAKVEGLQPTGSYKDRGSAILVSLLAALGIRRAVEDSSGNAAASLATYAARAGMALTIFCPASASRAKLLQVRLAGQPLRPVDGPRPRATEALLAHMAATGERYASHLWHPFFIEGLKTLAFEIVEQLGWRAPDAVVAPCGAGSILLGLHRGFRELRSTGLMDVLPRLLAVQAEAVAPVAEAWRAGQRSGAVAPFAHSRPSLAEGILLPAPVRGAELLAALDESGGSVVTVSEEEIAQGVRALGARGLAVEPTSAVVWRGLAHLREQQILRDGDLTVVVLSAHGLKAPAAIEPLLESPVFPPPR
jgi:threonine synthase